MFRFTPPRAADETCADKAEAFFAVKTAFILHNLSGNVENKKKFKNPIDKRAFL